MSDRPNNRLVLVAAGAAIAVAAFLMLRPSDPDEPGKVAGPATTAATPVLEGATPRGPTRREEKPLGRDEARTDAEAVSYLRDEFGATIENKRSQIKAIEKLISYLRKNYPDDWETRLHALLAQAFPGLGEQLYAQFKNMEAWNEWLKANREELAQMSPYERRDAMRDAQRRFFGGDADEIFAESRRNDAIYDAMASINESHDTTVSEKLTTYLDAINESYGEQAPDFIETRQTELTNGFLTLPSVQDELHAMSAEQRGEQLDSVRARMGMDEEARTRWRELDGQRDSDWQNGERYMEKRDEIVRSYQGDTQSRRLDELREQFFGDEADTIRSEEESGFFRFGHRRIYGKE